MKAPGKHMIGINREALAHVRGQSRFIDDLPEITGTLYGVAITSRVAHAKIQELNFDPVLSSKGVIAVFSAKDVCGRNQIGPIVEDEPLFAEKTIHFYGQPLGFVVADSRTNALSASKKYKINCEELPVTTNAKEAYRKKSFILPPRTFQTGQTTGAFETCDHVVEGTAYSGGQEHLYMETQGAYAWPADGGSLKILSSTQGPGVVQRITARVLGIPMHRIEVEIARIGGGFGGKEDQATPWAVMTALAAHLLDRPVKYILSREEDMRYTGKRHAYMSEYKLGMDDSFRIKAYEVTFYQNAGAAADLSPAILERSLLHVCNAYYIPNMKAIGYSCRTNLPPATAFRGFGAPQAMFALESAIDKAADMLKVDPEVIQKINLIREGQHFYYGQKAEDCQIGPCWEELISKYDFPAIRKHRNIFNNRHKLIKKGISFMPVCFGISFTNTSMNHGRALVHVYQDGSVGVSTGAVEMGQGVNTKLLQIATRTFGISPDRIKLESTNTSRVANASPSAASSTTDLNGFALIDAIDQIKSRLFDHVADILSAKKSSLSIRDECVCLDAVPTYFNWKELIQSAFLARVNLSAKGHYARPHIYFDTQKEKGHPFAYHVYGVALTEVTLDCLRGTYHVDSVKVVHDGGSSINDLIDRGQMEGGIVQGIGWMTMEELVYEQNGRLTSDALSTYKIPDMHSVPATMDVHFLRSSGNSKAVLKAKAVGEPPFMYGIGTYFALLQAMKAFRPGMEVQYSAPLTPEKVLLALYGH